jgi:multidrug efflux pump subunit AcrA (membrane-fusion protein)
LLQEGAILTSGTLAARIDPTDYELAVREFEANLANLDARIEELDAREENARDSLAIDEASLTLAEAELQRLRSLLGGGGASQSDIDAQSRSALAQRAVVQNSRNALRLIPRERAALQADRAAQRARLDRARLDLERTRIRLPMRGRAARVEVEEATFAQVGQRLFTLDGIEIAEISAQTPMARLRPLINAELAPAALLAELNSREFFARFGLTALVRFRFGDATVEWEARFSRISDAIDPRTRTVGVIVEVDRPYDRAIPGVRPPLAKGLYCEVEIRGPARPNLLVAPISALREGAIFVVGPDDRLERREIEIELEQPGFIAIASGVSQGERIAIGDLPAAIEGMRLDPRDDPDALAALLADAAGESPPR